MSSKPTRKNSVPPAQGQKKSGAVINKHLAFWLYIALAVVTAALLIMTVIASTGKSSVWTGAPVMIVLVILGIALAVSVVAFNPRKNFYSLGFYILHIGIILFFIGSFVYTVSGESVYINVVNGNSVTNTIQYQMERDGYTKDDILNLKDGFSRKISASEEGGEPIDLGFFFRISDFKTEYYDPVYSYTDESGVSVTIAKEDVLTDSEGKKYCLVGKDGEEKRYEVVETSGVKHYEATLVFSDSGMLSDLSTESLTVNHPIYRGDWKIYLMASTVDYSFLATDPNFLVSLYGTPNRAYGVEIVQLMVKKDPTEFVSVAGILLIILGTFMMCLIRPREKAVTEAEAVKNKPVQKKVKGGDAK